MALSREKGVRSGNYATGKSQLFLTEMHRKEYNITIRIERKKIAFTEVIS